MCAYIRTYSTCSLACVHKVRICTVHTYVHTYMQQNYNQFLTPVYTYVRMSITMSLVYNCIAGQNFRRFCSLPNICENKIHELGIRNCVLLLHGKQASVKINPRIFIIGAIRENFVPQKFPAIWYGCLHWFVCCRMRSPSFLPS